MYTTQLECDLGHLFEGWYDSVDDYEAHIKKGDLCCPLCDSEFVMRQSSAQTLAGKAVMGLIKRIKSQSVGPKDDCAGPQFFKVFLN